MLNATGFPRITIVFFIIITIVLFNAIANYYYITKEKDNIRKITELINPYIEDLDRLNEIILESKMYTTNWVHVPNSLDDKSSLDSIHHKVLPTLKSSLVNKSRQLQGNHPDLVKTKELDSIFIELKKLVEMQQSVMRLLKNFDDYENPGKKFKAEDIVESNVFPAVNVLTGKLRFFTAGIRSESNDLKKSIMDDSDKKTNILILLSFSLLFFIAISVYIIISNIRRPSIQMKSIIDNLSKGDLTGVHVDTNDNIIGEMAVSLNKLSDNFTKTASFAKEIEQGNLTAEYEKLSEKDQLGEALISMRNSLHAYSGEMELKVKQRTEEVVAKGLQIETQKLFYESVLSSIPIDISIYDENKRYIYSNEKPLDKEETSSNIIGKTDTDLGNNHYLKHETIAKRSEFFDLARLNKTTTEYEDFLEDGNGNKVWKLRRFTPVFDNNNFQYMISYGLDISEMKNQESQIKESLEEKESLLGEIHHRVKNNLTLVLGLIEMQKDRQKDDHFKNQFNEIKNRIYAMSLIHDKMYKSHSFANIELHEYIRDLVTSISRFYGKGKTVALQFDLEQTVVKGKEAIPIALLMNELVTNSFKYAFNLDAKEESSGALFVSLKHNPEIVGGYILFLKDNGPGMPEDLDLSKSKSLGFKLIHIFVKQLRGEMKYFNNEGLNFEIKFKV